MTINFDLEEISCGQCGITFAVPANWVKTRRERKDTFYCPNGHPRAYVEGRADQLQRELDRAKQNAAYLQDQVKYQRERAEAEERRRAALKGQLTKLKKRSAGGVCPCCNRTFLSLARHMAQKHPTFVCEPLADNVIELGQNKLANPLPLRSPTRHLMHKRNWAEINAEIEQLDKIERNRAKRSRGKPKYSSPDAAIIRMGQLLEERMEAADREREERSK